MAKITFKEVQDVGYDIKSIQQFAEDKGVTTQAIYYQIEKGNLDICQPAHQIFVVLNHNAETYSPIGR